MGAVAAYLPAHRTAGIQFPVLRSDHYFNGKQKDAIDVYRSFVMAAEETERIRFGPLVTPVTFREPVNVGRMAQQLDSLADGRFVMGLDEVVFEHFCHEDDTIPEWIAAEVKPRLEAF